MFNDQQLNIRATPHAPGVAASRAEYSADRTPSAITGLSLEAQG
jgi:hypothetical protein